MRAAAFALPLILTACATPREACINDANRELRTIDRLVIETRANLARGFALEERQEVRVVRADCEGENEDGTTFTFRCDQTETFTRREPVAIDLNAERAKLQSLEERQRQMRVNRDSAIAQCQAQFSE